MRAAPQLKCHTPEQSRYLSALFTAIPAFYGERLCSLAVFGSMARRQNRLDSDCDLFIVLEHDGGFGSCVKRNREFLQIEKSLADVEADCFRSGVSMDLAPVILTRRQAGYFNPLYLDMTEAVVIVVDRDRVLQAVLDKVAAKMRSWGSRRVDCGGSWYWMIKPELSPGETIDYEL